MRCLSARRAAGRGRRIGQGKPFGSNGKNTRTVSSMIYWLYEHRHWFGGDSSVIVKLLNIFKYHTFRAGGAALTAFLLSLAFGERVIRKLISLKVGQPIRSREEVQQLFELHGKKAGT